MPLPPTVALAQRDTVRVIPSGRLRPPALRPLAGDDRALEALSELESVTNGRVRAEEAGLADLDRRELAFGRAGASLINAAFTHTRPGGNRFNDEDRGAWYCAFAVETALGEVAYHLSRELAAVGRFDNVTDYAELFADFSATFHDLRGLDRAGEPALAKDPEVAYPVGQALARRLRREASANGIVYPSIRHAGGTCLVAFRPDLVQNLRQGALWRLAWQGAPSPTITRG